MPSADVREIECQVLGAPACRYEINWIPMSQPLPRGLAGGALGLAMGGLVLGPPGAFAGALVGTLATLTASYRALERDRTRQVLDGAEAANR